MTGGAPILPVVAGVAAQMPSAPAERRVLDQRAEVLARPRSSVDHGEPGMRYLRCRLGATEAYGIPYSFLEEVIYPDSLERVPGAPAFVRGIIARRGELLTVIDPVSFFRVEPADLTAEARIVVVRNGADRVGLLFNAVDGDDLYHPSHLVPPFASAGIANVNHVEGIHAASVTILRIDALLTDPVMVVDQRNERRRGD